MSLDGVDDPWPALLCFSAFFEDDGIFPSFVVEFP